MKILIKFPTRQRPEKFFNALDKYISEAENISNIGFLITLDKDDITMNNEQVIAQLDYYKEKVKLVYIFGESKSKIQAVNADVNRVSSWDILILASDDMIPIVKGYDTIIRNDMNDHFRDSDGILWYNDGGQDRINTLCILGKKYYERFNYIYHPDYISFYCDNEFTTVSQILNKCYRSDKVIIEHQHPAWEKAEQDLLYLKNEQYMYIDSQTYIKRIEKNFDLDKLNQKLLSVLILGIPERISKLDHVIKTLEQQIHDNNAREQVEILAIIDNKSRTVGSKRQVLLNAAEGKFVAYLDDDDTISEDYIKELMLAIKTNPDVDVVSFNQETRIDNDPPGIVYFGLQYTNTEYRPGIPVYRKPFHMCAWNVKIAKLVSFKNISLTEDWTWIEELCKYAKTEHHINKILHDYIYNSNTTTSTW